MTKLKVLNLYAGIGGNRKLWTDVDVTAVELNPEIAKIYQDFFPEDKVIIADAHQYLLEHYKEYDFIWSSPPCPTHSDTNFFLNAQGVIRYPDMTLWQEIIFLNRFFKGKWIVENVNPYYEAFKEEVRPQEVGRHTFWSNFLIPKISIAMTIGRMNGKNQHRERSQRMKEIAFDLSDFNIKDKEKILNNCVNPKLGLHILNCATKGGQLQLLLNPSLSACEPQVRL